MSTREEQREALVKETLSLIEKAKAGDESAFETAETKAAELKAFDAQTGLLRKGDELYASLAGSGSSEKAAAEVDPFEQFVSSYRSKGKASLDLSLVKANTDPTTTGGSAGALAPWMTAYQGIVQGYRRRPTVTDLIPSVATTAQAITYLVEAAREGDPAAVNEGAAKAQIHYVNPTVVTDVVRKLAAYTRVSDETFSDLPALIANIRGRLLYDLSIVEEDQLLNGDGNAPNISGILDRSIGTETSTDSDDNVDAIYRAASTIQQDSGFNADGIVIHPADYEPIRLSKDLNGQYFGGGFFTGPYGNDGFDWQPPIWGIRTVVTPAIDQGTVLVGAFQQSSTVYRNGGVTVETSNSDSDNFTKNLVTILAETRLALAVTQPLGFVAVDLSAS